MDLKVRRGALARGAKSTDGDLPIGVEKPFSRFANIDETSHTGYSESRGQGSNCPIN
jgi:hypothetical protein